MKSFRLQKEKTALIVIDMQERLYSHLERACEVLHEMKKVIQAFHFMHLPVIVTEQYPEKMGPTLAALKEEFSQDQKYLTKTTFSCLQESSISQEIATLPQTQFVLIGIEAHVCVLQTAKDLVDQGKEVVVLNDAITSRSIYNYSTAIAEMRDCGVRISCVETVLFELMHDAKTAEFKAVCKLIK